MTFRKTIRDKRLDELSDMVRRGIPIRMEEAIEVIEYQEALRKNRKQSLKDKFINFLK